MLRLIVFRLLPVLFVAIGSIFYFVDVQGEDAFVLRNSIPVVAVCLLSAVTLFLGRGHWSGAGWRWPLGTLGFAVPALGLSLYLHYGYATDMNGMFSESVYPGEIFRYLPYYTSLAGGIGFAIGWLAGKNV